MKARSPFDVSPDKLRPSSSIWFQLKVGTFLATALILIGGCVEIMAQSSYTQKDPWKGREIFQAKGCAHCHAVYGVGGKIGPDLGERKFYGNYLQLAGVLWNHFPRMYEAMQKEQISWHEFSDQEMSDLIAYLFYIRYIGEPGNEHRGRKLLQSKGCIKCHKFGGVGGDIGPDISQSKEYMAPLQLAETLWNHGPQMMPIFEEKKIKRPEFTGNEMVDLAVAIRSYTSPTKVPLEAFSLGDPVRGEALMANKGCKNCHSIRGVGGDTGPDFMDVNLDCSVTEIAGRMWNHGPKMWEAMQSKGMAVPTFEKGEMADVIAYIYGLKLKETQGNAEKGRAVLDEKQCLSCHAMQGKGADIAPDLAVSTGPNAPLDMVTTMWNHAPGMQEKIGGKKLQWPKFTGDEMADLFAYLHALK